MKTWVTTVFSLSARPVRRPRRTRTTRGRRTDPILILQSHQSTARGVSVSRLVFFYIFFSFYYIYYFDPATATARDRRDVRCRRSTADNGVPESCTMTSCAESDPRWTRWASPNSYHFPPRALKTTCCYTDVEQTRRVRVINNRKARTLRPFGSGRFEITINVRIFLPFTHPPLTVATT